MPTDLVIHHEPVARLGRLLDLYKLAVKATHQVRVAEALALEAQANYNKALHQALIDECVPPGRSIDVLGDGKIKPADQCAQDLQR